MSDVFKRYRGVSAQFRGHFASVSIHFRVTLMTISSPFDRLFAPLCVHYRATLIFAKKTSRLRGDRPPPAGFSLQTPILQTVSLKSFASETNTRARRPVSCPQLRTPLPHSALTKSLCLLYDFRNRIQMCFVSFDEMLRERHIEEFPIQNRVGASAFKDNSNPSDSNRACASVVRGWF